MPAHAKEQQRWQTHQRMLGRGLPAHGLGGSQPHRIPDSQLAACGAWLGQPGKLRHTHCAPRKTEASRGPDQGLGEGLTSGDKWTASVRRGTEARQ